MKQENIIYETPTLQTIELPKGDVCTWSVNQDQEIRDGEQWGGVNW